MRSNRRQFFKVSAATAACLGLGDLQFLSRLPRLSAAEAVIPPNVVRFSPEIEPLVQMIEDTPRERLLEEVASRIHRGLSYRQVLTALMLAGVRNIQPRPVGFKFHSVLVVNSAHLASLSSPDSDRWLPIFWALDYFKSAQAQDAHEGDWAMAAPDDSKLPSSRKARRAFIEAMDNWDEPAADAAVTGLARTAGAQEIFEIFCRYGARDFRDIGHKAIYVANSWRTLQAIGWQHAEPVLRSLAYALLDRGGGPNPAKGDLEADRPWRRNQAIAGKIRPDWLDGETSSSATSELLGVLRQASPEEASAQVVELLNRGVSAQSIWDALFNGAGELLVRRPGIISLHAVTSTNALHFAFQTSSNDEIRRLLLLQNAAFLTLFRGDETSLSTDKLDELQLPNGPDNKAPTLDEIFNDISQDRMRAAGKTLAWLKTNPLPNEFIAAARRFVFLKGTNSHDYKFSSAVLEDYQNISPAWRDHYLAASVFNLRGSGDADNNLVERTRSALQA
jgi:hypothetical protein